MWNKIGKLENEIERIEAGIEWNREEIVKGNSLTYHGRCIRELQEVINTKELKIKELELWWETA